MLDRMVEKACQQDVCSREDTPLRRRVLTAFLYHAGLSCRKIEPFVDRSHEAIRQWFHRLKHLFESDCRQRDEIAIDETTVEIDGEEVYVWAAVDRATLEVLAVDVSPGRSSLDALLFLREVLKRCRGRPLVRADRGPRYDWPLDLLECDDEEHRLSISPPATKRRQWRCTCGRALELRDAEGEWGSTFPLLPLTVFARPQVLRNPSAPEDLGMA
ncbi:DDE-type integrase/transposase/recombinase [Halomarina halobia]|uniref:DDE-type integrase/transposase/recombinase n=1 Tax=Halomarina halobia TaxID=3033386 RepID=A0ABD6ACU0_9EURY